MHGLLRLGLLLATLGVGFSAWADGVAQVVRAHPWLTRGVARESLVGVRFAENWGGFLGQITFTLKLTNCAREALGELRLYRQPAPAFGFYEATAVRLDGTYLSASETWDAASGTLTVTYRNTASGDATSPGWIFPFITGNEKRTASDRVWLTAAIDPEIGEGATIEARVADTQLSLSGSLYDVADGAPGLHRVYPYCFRVSAYLPSGKVGAVILNEAEQRLPNLTESIHFEVAPTYDSEADGFGLELGSTASAWAALRAARDRASPLDSAGRGTRLILGLTKGKTALTLDSMGSGTAFAASPLGHAAGSAYRAGFVAAVVALMEAEGFDGLDIDWEYPNLLPNGTEVENGEEAKYGALLRDLAEAFFPRGWTLTLCTNQSGWHVPGGEVLAAADAVHAMAYGPWPTFLGNAVMSQGIRICTARGVPARRIVVGLPMYSNAAFQYGWGNLAAKVQAAFPDDPIAQTDCDTLWESWSYNGKSGNYINFNGPSTLRAKCNRIRLEGYGGAMSWGYYSDVAWTSPLSLARHKAQAIWPHGAFPEPPRAADGFYELASESDWFWFREHPDCNVRLVCDIRFDHDPLPLERFDGELDGNGHTLTLPADTWICTFGQSALIRTLAGSVRNLTVVLEGRVLTRADRASDTACDGSGTLEDACDTALLAAGLSGGARIEDVTLTLRPGAEIQGALKTALCVASAWAPAGSSALLRRVNLSVEGTLRAYADTSGGTPFHPNSAAVGALAGWIGGPTGATVTVEDCTVVLAPSARILAETGSSSSVGGCVGNLNNATPTFTNLTLVWSRGAEIAGREETATTPMPWIASYVASMATANISASGRILAPANFPWSDWWLKTLAPLHHPGYRLWLK
ncbi:MAG: glycoside hydrolase family 18 protein [Candidatus Spyradenecus sp.]